MTNKLTGIWFWIAVVLFNLGFACVNRAYVYMWNRETKILTIGVLLLVDSGISLGVFVYYYWLKRRNGKCK